MPLPSPFNISPLTNRIQLTLRGEESAQGPGHIFIGDVLTEAGGHVLTEAGGFIELD